jgi:hypothetical protein
MDQSCFQISSDCQYKSTKLPKCKAVGNMAKKHTHCLARGCDKAFVSTSTLVTHILKDHKTAHVHTYVNRYPPIAMHYTSSPH